MTSQLSGALSAASFEPKNAAQKCLLTTDFSHKQTSKVSANDQISPKTNTLKSVAFWEFNLLTIPYEPASLLKTLKNAFSVSRQKVSHIGLLGKEMKFLFSRFRQEFKYEILSVPKKNGEKLIWHDVSACITPEETEEESLQKAWKLVQDLAQWLKKKTKKNLEVENFRIIVGWSKTIRERQGQIFKIWEPNTHLDEITSSKSLEEYKIKIEDDYPVPFKGWQRDVFLVQKT